MAEDEIHFLRATNIRLEHEAQILKLAYQRVEKELAIARVQLEGERQLVKALRNERVSELRALRENETKKLENAINDLKTRLHVERSQSLENQRLQLERNFRSELIKLVHKKDSQLHLLFTHSQRVKIEADKKRAADRQHCRDTYQVHLGKLKQDFQKQLTRLLLELKSKERHIESLEKTVQNVSNSSLVFGGVSFTSPSASSLSSPSSALALPSSSFPPSSTCDNDEEQQQTSKKQGKQQQHESHRRPASRNKSYRQSRIAQHPYNPSSGKQQRRHESNPKKLKMKEMGETQPVDSQQFFYHHPYGGSALETLPEAESEEECSEIEDIVSETGNPSAATTSCSSQASDDNFLLSHATSLEIRNASDGQPIIRCESSEDQRHKIVSLEATIRQLRDELRECKDQNELLEFRLLEIEEIGGNTSAQIRGDYDSSSNSHASVAESRSSCSDCSDSLSLQESGIFDSQSVHDDTYAGLMNNSGFGNLLSSPKEDISRELAHLTAQIEGLVIRFAEGSATGDVTPPTMTLATTPNTSSTGAGTGNGAGSGVGAGAASGPGTDDGGNNNRDSGHPSKIPDSVGRCSGGNGNNSSGSINSSNSNSNGSPTHPHPTTSSSRSKAKRSQDLTIELKSCRQRIQEFEKRLTQFADINYVNSLEDKVSLLIHENQRLEEERAELEEAENDSRHQCQRLEEKMIHLRQKKALLQQQLSSEKLFIEQLRIKILQLQEREEDLTSQIIRVDALVQNYEHRNFELEESCIEMKCSVQFVVHSLPVLLLWYLWSILRTFQIQSRRLDSTIITSATGPTTITTARFPFSDDAHGLGLLPFPSLPLPPCPSSLRSLFPRKHKLHCVAEDDEEEEEVTSPEPSFKKLRCEKKECLVHLAESSRRHLNQNLRNLNSTSVALQTCLPSPSLSDKDSQSQTCEESWKSFVDEIISVQRREWLRVEKSLQRKIELLECDIDKYQEVFDSERGKLVQHYEGKLSEQERALRESQRFLQERETLQEKWEGLLRELEDFALSLKTGSCSSRIGSSSGSIRRRSCSSAPEDRKGKEGQGGNRNSSEDTKSEEIPIPAEPSAPKRTDGDKIKGGSLVANRIRSLFPGEWRGGRQETAEGGNGSNKKISPDNTVTPAPGPGPSPTLSSAENETTPTTTPTSTPTPTSTSNVTSKSAKERKNELVRRLEEEFQEQLSKFEKREKVLLDEIDRLKSDMGPKSLSYVSHPEPVKVKVQDQSTLTLPTDHHFDHPHHPHSPHSPHHHHHHVDDEGDKTRLVYLAEENNRLQMILSDQESVLSKVKDLEEENEKLATELATNGTLRKRLEESHGAETSLRNRIEELEQNEIYVKETAEQVERRERKCLERISQLREEIQFLRNKCCQLQDDLDSKISREAKYKNEIQTLANKVKGLMLELEEKDNLLENNATSSQSQISKLRAQLNDVHKQLADAECSNGMLREEVLYLERTLQEAIERSATTEKMIVMLTSELQQREVTVESLQKELENHRNGCQPIVCDPENQITSNDLDVFAQNEGGLFGVDRDIKNIASQIQSCSRESCKSSSKKLTEVSEQLNTLTMMLGSTPDMDRINGDSHGIPELLSRCESDECLSRGSMVPVTSKDLPTNISKLKEFPDEMPMPIPSEVTHLESELEDRDAQIMTLRETMSHLTVQICQLEELYNIRQKELRESHLTECSWYNSRCRTKNDLIQILARRIAHLSATDRHGIFLETILTEIKQLERDESYPTIYQLQQLRMNNNNNNNNNNKNKNNNIPTEPDSEKPLNFTELDFTYESLCLFLNYERKRIMNLMESACQDGNIENPLDGADLAENQELEFRICRRVSEDALLVSWSIPDKYSMDKVDGYEISVNGNVFLRIPKPNRFKVVLFGLNLNEPLHLSLKCTGAFKLQESTITYIA